MLPAESLFFVSPFVISELVTKTFIPEILEDLKEENRLSSEYQKLKASAKIELDGKTYNLAGLSPLMESSDRSLRKRASEANSNFYVENEKSFDEIYDKLVKLRHGMALKMGYKNYVELGYIKMLRSDYTANEISEYRNLIHNMPDGVYKSTEEGRFIDANPALVKMLGYDSKEELMAIDIKTQLYFELSERYSIVLQEKERELGVYRLKKKDGSELWVEDHQWLNFDKTKNILFHEGILRDITERLQAEEKVRESENKLQEIEGLRIIGQARNKHLRKPTI